MCIKTTFSTVLANRKRAAGIALSGAVLAAGILGTGMVAGQAAAGTAEPTASQSQPAAQEGTGEQAPQDVEGEDCEEDFAKQSTITKEAALQAALAAHPGATAIGAPEAFPWDEDSVVWEVLLSSEDSKEVIVTVNATDGTIIESEVLDPAQPVDAVELNLDQPCQ